MILTILQHTPPWVWALLAGLIALGLTQARDRDMTLPRLLVMPLLLLALSLTGVLSAFGGRPIALCAWGLGLALALAGGRGLLASRGARWCADSRRMHVPGSWLPLALIIVLFSIKYLVGVSLAIQPRLAHDATFAGLCGLAYGGFSGLFLARALSLFSLARRDSRVTAAATVGFGLSDGRNAI